MTNVARIRPEHKSLNAPAELRSLPAWLCWRSEQHDGEEKPRKVPYWSSGGRRHGKQGSPDDLSRLVTFPAAVAAAQRLGMDGVGFAPLPEWGVTALDFDKCVGPDGALPPEVAAIVKDTYSEYSPSGQGVRAFVRGDLGNHKDIARNGAWGFETFATKGFVTLTGNQLPHVDLLELEDVIAPVTSAVRTLCDKRFGKRDNEFLEDDFTAGYEPRHNLTTERMQELLDALDPDMGRDEWIRVGMALHHESEGDDSGFDLWNEWSAQGAKYPDEEALRQQWDSFTRRAGPGQRQVTMASVIAMANAAAEPDAADLSALAEESRGKDPNRAPRTPEGFDGKFKAVSAAEIATRPPIDWLVKGVIPRVSDPTIIFGAPGSGKSFSALDLACAVARGVEWRGHRVRQGRVLIIAAEGSEGISQRLRAYARHHGVDIDELDIAVIEAAPNFLQKDDIREVVKAISAIGGVDLALTDTLAQVTPGANENAGEDMGLALANARVISQVTGATMLIVHHSGKDASKGSRGWSGIKGAAAAQLEVVRHENGHREIAVEKMKDGRDGDRYGFRLMPVDLGFDRDGDPLESMVVVEDALPSAPVDDEPRRSVVRYGRHERHVLEVIESEFASDEAVGYQKLVDKCVEMLSPPEDGKRDARRFLVTRAIQTLAKRKDPLLGVQHGQVVFYT